MKRVLLAICTCALIYACSEKKLTKQEIAELNVKQYLMENLNDTTGYQSISFDSIKDRYTSYLDTSDFSYMDNLENYNKRQDSLEKAFKPEKIGLSITHKYRAKNALNALLLKEQVFNLDSNLKVISVD